MANALSGTTATVWQGLELPLCYRAYRKSRWRNPFGQDGTTISYREPTKYFNRVVDLSKSDPSRFQGSKIPMAT